MGQDNTGCADEFESFTAVTAVIPRETMAEARQAAEAIAVSKPTRNMRKPVAK